MMSACPCCSKRPFFECCAPYLKGSSTAPSPEALMRSRYTAYTLAQIPYIQKTMQGKPLLGFNPPEAEHWAKSVKWTGLTVIQSFLTSPIKGYVEFIAHFEDHHEAKTIHELSEFSYVENQWFYVDGSTPKMIKPSRNAPCYCGSQKKFKHCHGASS